MKFLSREFGMLQLSFYSISLTTTIIPFDNFSYDASLSYTLCTHNIPLLLVLQWLEPSHIT